LCSTFCTIEANYWQTRSIARPLCDSRASSLIFILYGNLFQSRNKIYYLAAVSSCWVYWYDDCDARNSVYKHLKLTLQPEAFYLDVNLVFVLINHSCSLYRHTVNGMLIATWKHDTIVIKEFRTHALHSPNVFLLCCI